MDWPTAYVAEQLVPLLGAGHPALTGAAAALIARQRLDGGWGYHAGVPADADSTAWVVLLLCATAAQVAGAPEAIARGAAWLREAQQPGGGVPTYREPAPIRAYLGLPAAVSVDGWCAPHLEVTATAGRALLAAGPRWRDAAEEAWTFVRQRRQPDYAWSSYWWTGRAYPTLQATLLAAALDRPRHEWCEPPINLTDPAREAATAINEQHRSGAEVGAPTAHPFDAFETALALLALRLGAGDAAASTLARTLHDAQLDDGSWRSPPMLRIPPPGEREPERGGAWDEQRLGVGVVLADHHRLFTTATCLRALHALDRAR